jgi:hypothetical protein
MCLRVQERLEVFKLVQLEVPEVIKEGRVHVLPEITLNLRTLTIINLSV